MIAWVQYGVISYALPWAPPASPMDESADLTQAFAVGTVRDARRILDMLEIYRISHALQMGCRKACEALKTVLGHRAKEKMWISK